MYKYPLYLSTPERRCIGVPEQKYIRDERQKAPAGAFWRLGGMEHTPVVSRCPDDARGGGPGGPG